MAPQYPGTYTTTTPGTITATTTTRSPQTTTSLTPEQLAIILKIQQLQSQQQNKPDIGGVAKGVVGDVAKKQVKNYITGSATPAATSAESLFGASTAATPVGTAANGGILMSDGSVMGGGMSMQGGGTAAVDAAGNVLGAEAMGSAPLYVPAAVIAQTLLSGKAGYDMLRGKAKKIDQLRWEDIKNNPAQMAGRAGLAIATGGLSELANSFLSHKSTKQYQQERRDKLRKAGVSLAEDQVAQMSPEQKAAYDAQAAADVQNLGLVDHGANFNSDLKKGLVKPEETWGALAHYQMLGNDYLGKSTGEQRRLFNKLLIDSGNLVSDKGDVLYKDKNKAMDLWNQVMSGNTPASGASIDPGFNRPVTNTLWPQLSSGKVENPIGKPTQGTQAFTAQYLKPAQTAQPTLQTGTIGVDYRADPKQVAGYNQMTTAQKNDLWAKHKAAMGVK